MFIYGITYLTTIGDRLCLFVLKSFIVLFCLMKGRFIYHEPRRSFDITVCFDFFERGIRHGGDRGDQRQ